MTYAIALILGYILGSIPFGLILTRLSGQGDIRNIGSGNIGATNVLRTGRKDLAVLTLLLDAGKAGVAVLLVQKFFGAPMGLFAGAAALLGHCFPIWIKFKGGKGVATFFGCLLAVAWPVGLASMAVWLVVAFMFKMSSLAALFAAVAAPILAYFMGFANVAIMAACLTIIIFIRHRDNISRILAGSETKIGSKG